MMEIKLLDKNFAHAHLFGSGEMNLASEHFQWYRGDEPRQICFLTDSYLKKIKNRRLANCPVNIAWLLEPPSIAEKNYRLIRKKKYYSRFDFVLTYLTELLPLDERFIWYPHGGCWIHPEDHGIYPKTEKISIIASDKKKSAGHRLRHEVIKQLGHKLEMICGRGYKPFDYKLEALKDYEFSIIIENGRFDTYFTEKIIDCFMTGTIPVYWGCSLQGLFDEDGIIYFNSPEELSDILDRINRGHIRYEDRLPAVRNNFDTARKYTIMEDWLYANVIKKILSPNRFDLPGFGNKGPNI